MSLFLVIRACLLVLPASCLVWGLTTQACFAQSDSEERTDEEVDDNPYGSGSGLGIVLTNSGFGLEAYHIRKIGRYTSFLVEANLGTGKDESELKFFQFGNNIIPNKRNYFLMLPIQIGFQQRLFAESIENNFRPYLHVSGGPTLGWQYPYFADQNGNEAFDEGIDKRLDIFSGFSRGQPRFGLGGTIALGAYFGLSRKVTQGIRFGYAFHYFFQGIQLLEPGTKAAQRLFRTPIISITFGRLL